MSDLRTTLAESLILEGYVPRFPDDFRVLHVDGGASYWWWSPYTDASYTGTWPTDEDSPTGLMIVVERGAEEQWGEGDQIVVSWIWGATDGPEYILDDPRDLIPAIERVMRMVREELDAQRRAEAK